MFDFPLLVGKNKTKRCYDRKRQCHPLSFCQKQNIITFDLWSAALDQSTTFTSSAILPLLTSAWPVLTSARLSRLRLWPSPTLSNPSQWGYRDEIWPSYAPLYVYDSDFRFSCDRFIVFSLLFAYQRVCGEKNIIDRQHDRRKGVVRGGSHCVCFLFGRVIWTSFCRFALFQTVFCLLLSTYMV